MNIALCTDENFSIPALVCITSVLENNKEEDCHIYVLTDGLSDKARDKFSKLSDIYGQKIDIMNIDKHIFDGLIVNERFPISMYYRFLLPETLPEVDKILYLDCDIIVRHSLRGMYETDLTDKGIAAVVAQSCDDIVWANQLKLSSAYFNSGVLLMNLEYWRQNCSFGRLVEWIANNSDKCNLPDQNALNVVFDGNVEYLDYSYNYQEGWFNIETSKVHYSKWNEIVNSGEEPVIVHFCEAEKPWFVECENPYKTEWKMYADKHKFICFKIQKRYGKEYQLAVILDKVGLKFRYWAEKWQKKIVKKLRVS